MRMQSKKKNFLKLFQTDPQCPQGELYPRWGNLLGHGGVFVFPFSCVDESGQVVLLMGGREATAQGACQRVAFELEPLGGAG